MTPRVNIMSLESELGSHRQSAAHTAARTLLSRSKTLTVEIGSVNEGYGLSAFSLESPMRPSGGRPTALVDPHTPPAMSTRELYSKRSRIELETESDPNCRTHHARTSPPIAISDHVPKSGASADAGTVTGDKDILPILHVMTALWLGEKSVYLAPNLRTEVLDGMLVSSDEAFEATH